MKKLKLFLFILLALIIGQTSTVSATEVMGSVTVTVITTPPVEPPVEPIVDPVATEYTITSSTSSGGTVSPLGVTKVKEGSNQDIFYTPNSGYQVSSIIVDGVPLDAFPANKINFSNIKSNHTVAFTFVDKNQITVNLSASPENMILPINSTTLKWVTTGNPTSCVSTGDWAGVTVSATGGTNVRNGLKEGLYTFGITCKKTGVADAKDTQLVRVNTIGVTLNIMGNTTITLPKDSVDLQWVVVGGPETCLASNSWSGYKSTQPNMPHQETIKNLKAGKYTFDILCKKGTEEAKASTTLTVLPDPNNKNPTGQLTGNDCLIGIGEKTCKTLLTWSVSNPVVGAETAVTNNDDKTSLKTSPSQATVYYPNTEFYLYHNGTEPPLRTLKLNATCDPATSSWDIVSGVCKALPKTMNGDITASDCYIKAGESSCSAPFSWIVNNPVNIGGSAVTNEGKTLASGDKGSSSIKLLYNNDIPTTLYLYNNGEPFLDRENVRALIDTNVCTWNIIDKVCDPLPVGPVVDGKWSDWIPDFNQCPNVTTQTRYCNNPAPSNGGQKCKDSKGAIDQDGVETISYTTNDCPSIDSMTVTYKGDNVGNTNKKVPYNSIVSVNWTSSNTIDCHCTSLDIKGIPGVCNSGINSPNPNKVSSLKRDIVYTVSCEGLFGSSVSRSSKVLVEDLSAGYTEE